MSHKILFLLYLFSIAVYSQDVPLPEHYSIVESVTGDLDNDGIDELVVAYNTEAKKANIDEGCPRVLHIYKRINDTWTLWQQSTQALYGSRDGGMMGDPFGTIEIKKGILEISQNGGSSWKWGHTDKYRYENGVFRLIGYSSMSGKLCEYWFETDFNLVTGKIIVKKEYEKCTDDNDETQVIYKKENETFYKKGIHLMLINRYATEIKIISLKYKHEIYL